MNTPAFSLLRSSKEPFATVLQHTGLQSLGNVEDAIAVATGDLGLLPGSAFQCRVMQLSQLCSVHQTVSLVMSVISLCYANCDFISPVANVRDTVRALVN